MVELNMLDNSSTCVMRFQQDKMAHLLLMYGNQYSNSRCIISVDNRLIPAATASVRAHAAKKCLVGNY